MGPGAMHRELIPSSNTSKAKTKQIQWVCTKELAMVTNEEIQKVLMSEGVHFNEQELNLVRDNKPVKRPQWLREISALVREKRRPKKATVKKLLETYSSQMEKAMAVSKNKSPAKQL